MHTTVGGQLGQWLALHTLGRKPRAKEFNEQIAGIIRKEWPAWLNASASSVTADQVTTFAERVAHYCPSRWNAIVSALHFITPEARHLKRRRIRSKKRPLLTQLEFSTLLERCDQLPRSRAGLVVRFLSQTGLRINEARQLKWSDVAGDHFNVPASITKNSEARVIPFIPGVDDTLQRLRALGDAVFVLPRQAARFGIYKACKLAGVPRLSYHDFRHLFATRCIQSGVDMPTVARWLGHSDGGALLARTYYHLVDEHSRKMAAKVTL